MFQLTVACCFCFFCCCRADQLCSMSRTGTMQPFSVANHPNIIIAANNICCWWWWWTTFRGQIISWTMHRHMFMIIGWEYMWKERDRRLNMNREEWICSSLPGRWICGETIFIQMDGLIDATMTTTWSQMEQDCQTKKIVFVLVPLLLLSMFHSSSSSTFDQPHIHKNLHICSFRLWWVR